MLAINRRALLRLSAASSAVALVPTVLAQTSETGVSQSATANPDFKPDYELELTATETSAKLFSGSLTQLWKYEAKVLQGDPRVLEWTHGSQFPVIRVRQGQSLRIYFHNKLPEESIIHWHGMHMPQKMDGHPMYAIAPGQTFVYEFTVNMRAGTYWFHPHPHHRTGAQVYRGLAGLLIIEDDESLQTGLPNGKHERVWVLQDRQFNRDNQLVYASMRMEMMMGFTGDRVLVNGLPDHVEQLGNTVYRIRLLNGSNSRFYKLAWNDARVMTVIGSDGGLLASPVDKPYVMLAPAERIDLWLDLSKDKPGQDLKLVSLAFTSGSMGTGMGMGGMGMGMRGMGGGMSASGVEMEVLTIQIEGGAQPSQDLPKTLSTINWPRIEEAVNANNPRTIRLQMGMGTVSLNDRTFEMHETTDDETVRAGTTEVWQFVNTSGHMGMSHPMHIHNAQFKVIERIQDPGQQSITSTMQDGLVDEGWKDVVIVMPGEQVKILIRFNNHIGIYLYHCHILEHEDLGMMRNYLVQA